MTILTTPDQIANARLLTLRKALQLEIKGLKMSRGVSVNKMVCQMLGLKTGTKREVTLAELNKVIDEIV